MLVIPALYGLLFAESDYERDKAIVFVMAGGASPCQISNRK